MPSSTWAAFQTFAICQPSINLRWWTACLGGFDWDPHELLFGAWSCPSSRLASSSVPSCCPTSFFFVTSAETRSYANLSSSTVQQQSSTAVRGSCHRHLQTIGRSLLVRESRLTTQSQSAFQRPRILVVPSSACHRNCVKTTARLPCPALPYMPRPPPAHRGLWREAIRTWLSPITTRPFVRQVARPPSFLGRRLDTGNPL